MSGKKHCEHCDDGDGGCVYPYYGLAPHKHDLSITGSIIGSTVLIGEIPDNFSPDFETPACGVYTHCPKCGKPK